jgi:hypothetical protein
MSHGIMFWGNSSHSSIIFKMQKTVIRIIRGYGYRDMVIGILAENYLRN